MPIGHEPSTAQLGSGEDRTLFLIFRLGVPIVRVALFARDGSQMSIRTQVALGCGVMVIVVAAFAGYSRTLNHDVAAKIAVVAERAMPQVQAAGDLAAAFAGVEAARQQVVAANAVAEHDDTYPIDTPPPRSP